jgi:hypothetical protein
MARGKHSEAEIIGALKQLEAGLNQANIPYSHSRQTAMRM